MLGPFVLNRPLGQGGMAVVWDGHHATGRAPVAIKVMKGGTDAAARRMFRDEVRAVARLDHPGVVRVLDVGELPPQVVSLGLTPGAPYLVMERAAGTLRRPASGHALRSILCQLLDALAHAHARGIVHLDLKATNVLVGGGRQGVRLSDFGLARAWRSHGPSTGRGSRGTPSHMAPEQLEGREPGPWSDLYALGVLAWRLATGERPYRARSVLEAARAMTRPLPAFTPVLGVPTGFEAWVRAMMQRDPERRFRRAADAAWALLALGDASAWSDPKQREAAASPSPQPDAITLIFDRPTRLDALPTDARALQPRPPPLPSTAAATDTAQAAAPTDLLGVGVGLFALRDVGVVGRRADQAWLWEQLVAVDRDASPRVVALTGPTGVGASRLARWLAERVHELGGGEVLVAHHGPAPEPGHGIGPMLARALQVVGQPASAVQERLTTLGLDELDASALSTVIAEDEAGAVLRSSAERHRLVEAALRCLGRERALVLCLDEVAHDPDALDLATFLVTRSDLRLLVVLTGAPPGAVTARDERTLAPLPPEALATLVDRYLGVDPRVREAVVERAHGLPMFALQLLGGLVDTGALRSGRRGLVAPDAVLAALPPTLPEAFRWRATAIAPDALPSLRLAALIGHVVPAGEWAAGREALGVPLADHDLQALLAAGLLRTVPQGYAFAHDALRTGLQLVPDRRRAWHGALAEVVHDPERRAHHLAAAGRWTAAIDALGVAAARALARGEARRGEALWRRQLNAMDQAGVPADDGRRAHAMLQVARSLRVRGAWAEAADAAQELLAAARGQGWARHEANALVELAMDRQNAGALDEARALLDDAYARSGPGSSPRAAAALRRALLAIDAGEADTAEAAATEALAFYEAPGAARSRDLHWNDDIGAGYARVVLGRLQLRAGNHDAGLRHLDRARSHFDAAGDRLATADALNYRAGALLSAGRASEAEAPFRAALAHYEALGAWSALLVRINLAVLALDTGRPSEALVPLERALDQLLDEGREAFVAAVRVFLLGCYAAAGRRLRFEQTARAAREGLATTGFVDPDVARHAAAAAAEAERRGWSAEAARDIAERQRARL